MDFKPSIRLELCLVILLQRRVLLLFDEIAVARCQYVDVRPHETAEGLLGGAYDRLATHVETGVDQYRAASQLMKSADEIVIERIGLAMHRLHASGIIDVRDCRNTGPWDVELLDPKQLLLVAGHFAAMALEDRGDDEHVGTVDIDVEPFREVLAEDRGSKRAKALAVLDL